MRLLFLASVSLALLSAPAAAEPDGGAFLNNGQDVSSLRPDFQTLGDSAELLKRGRYGENDHRGLAQALSALPAKLASSRALPADKLRPVVEAAETAGRREAAFWAGLSPEQKAGKRPIPPDAAAEVVAPLESVAASLAPLFAAAPRSAAHSAAAAPREERRSQTVSANVDGSVSRVQSAGGSSMEQAASFWDRNTRRGEVSSGPEAPAFQRAPAAAEPPKEPILAAAGPSLGLRLPTVAALPRRAAVPQASAPRAPQAGQLRDAASGATSQAVRAATRSGVPVRTAAPAPAAGSRAQAPAAQPLRVGVTPAEAQQAVAPQPGPCEVVLNAHPSLASMCKTSPNIALLLGGLLEAFLEQFGSLQAILLNLVFMLLGLVLSALSGFGLIAKVVIGMVSLGFLAYTLGPLLKQGWDAFRGWMGSQAGSMANAQSVMQMGKIGGTVLILAIMAAIGWGVGKTKPGAQAMGAMHGAVNSTLRGTGAASAVAALDSKVPAGVRAALQRIFGGGAPRSDAPEGPAAAAPAAQAAEGAARPAARPRAAAGPREIEPGLQARAERALGKPVEGAQLDAVQRAHEVGRGRPGRDGTAAGKGNYTPAQLREKARILKEAGFDPDGSATGQVRRLMKEGVVGDDLPVPGPDAAARAAARAQVIAGHRTAFDRYVKSIGLDPRKMNAAERVAMVEDYLAMKNIPPTSPLRQILAEPAPAPAAATPSRAGTPERAPAAASPPAPPMHPSLEKAARQFADQNGLPLENVRQALGEVANKRELPGLLRILSEDARKTQIDYALYSEELITHRALAQHVAPKFKGFAESNYRSAKRQFESHPSYYKIREMAVGGGQLAAEGVRLYRYIGPDELARMVDEGGLIPKAFKTATAEDLGPALRKAGGVDELLRLRVEADNPMAKDFLYEYTTHNTRGGLGAAVSAGDIKIEILPRATETYHRTSHISGEKLSHNEAGWATIDPVSIGQIKIFGRGCEGGCFAASEAGQALIRALLGRR